MKNAKPIRNVTRGRPIAFDKQDALERALKLFWDKGFETTSINDLTTIMGITPSSLYAAFGNKEKLFWDTVDLYAKKYAVDISKTLEEKPTVREAIYNLLKKLAKSYTSNSTPHGCLIVCAAINYSKESSNVHKILQEMRKSSELCIVDRIKQSMLNKNSLSLKEINNLGKFLALFIQGMSIQAQDGTSLQELEAAIEIAMNSLPIELI